MKRKSSAMSKKVVSRAKKQMVRKPYKRPVKPGEKKFLDTTIATTAITTTGVILNSSLNVIPQGDTQSERIGRKVTVCDVLLKGNITQPAQIITSLPQGLSDMCNNVRVIVYLDKQCNKATATVAQILQTTDENSFRNLEYVDRFQILYDETVIMNVGGLSNIITTPTFYAPGVRNQFGFTKKISVPITYDTSATTGAIGTITSNNIGIMAIATVANSSFVDGICRIRYTDQ